MIVAPFCKVHRQFGRNLASTWAKSLLQLSTNLLMPPHAPTHWHLLVEHLLIQGMAEPVARRTRPPRPDRHPAGLHQLMPTGQGVTLALPIFPRLLDARCHRCDGELHTPPPRGGQEFLVCERELLHLVLQQVANALWHPHRHSVEPPSEGPTVW